jgi:hypothetical protein
MLTADRIPVAVSSSLIISLGLLLLELKAIMCHKPTCGTGTQVRKRAAADKNPHLGLGTEELRLSVT